MSSDLVLATVTVVDDSPFGCGPAVAVRLAALAGVVLVLVLFYAWTALVAALNHGGSRPLASPYKPDAHVGRQTLSARSVELVSVDRYAASQRARARVAFAAILGVVGVFALVLPAELMAGLLFPPILGTILLIPVAVQGGKPGHPQRVTVGLSWLVGVLVAIAVDLAALAGASQCLDDGGGRFRGLVLSGVAICTLAATSVLWRFLRRGMTLPARELLARDERPPILLLRSFKDDVLRLRSSGLRSRSLYDLILGPRYELFEEVVRSRLSMFGPVVAVSDPRSRLQPAAASREHLSADWLSDISKWVSWSGVIVFVIGRTPGLHSELSRIVEMGSLQKLVILFPPVEETELAARLNELGGGLIEHVEGALASVLGSDNQLTTFTGARRDEWRYQCAIEQAVRSSQEGHSATRPLSRPMSIDVELDDGPLVLGRIYYLWVGGRTVGPLTLLDLRRTARMGRLRTSGTSPPRGAEPVSPQTTVFDGAGWRRLGELSEVYSTKQRSVAIVLSLLLGMFGADRFYLHRFGSGAVKALTLGMCGVWWLLDLTMLLARVTTDHAGRPLR